MNAHIKNTANGGNNNAPQYKTNESNVAVKNRGVAKPSLARRTFCPRCCSPRANSSFVPSCGVFKNPVVLIALLLLLLLFLFTPCLLFCALDSSASERGIIFPIRRVCIFLRGQTEGLGAHVLPPPLSPPPLLLRLLRYFKLSLPLRRFDALSLVMLSSSFFFSLLSLQKESLGL
jgi:hypothetical protein